MRKYLFASLLIFLLAFPVHAGGLVGSGISAVASPAHRYWKITGYTGDASFGQIAEIQLRTTPGGATVTGSGTASASSYYGAGYEPSKAVDGDSGTYWGSAATGPPWWWKYDFGVGNAFNIVEVLIQARSTAGQYTPTTFRISYSDDDTTYVDGIYQFFSFANGQSQVFDAAFWTELSPHNMTSNSLPSPFVASASSEYYSAYKAFDGTNGTFEYWLSNGSPTGWLKIDLGAAKICNRYAVQVNFIPEPNRAPKNWTFEGSSTGDFSGEQTTLDTQTNQSSWGGGEKRTFTISSPGSYRYYRINITANNGDAGYVQVGELYLYGP